MRVRSYGAGLIGAAALAVLGALLVPASAAPPPTCLGYAATIVGTEGDDVLVGTEGPDVISAGDGADRVDARGAGDLVCGGNGDDVLTGGAGEDELSGGPGADELSGGDEGDGLAGGPGDDLLRGGADAFGASDLATFDDATAGVRVDLADRSSSGPSEGTDTLIGIEGARGSSHPDVLLGGRLPDLLIANGADDVLRGHAGADTLRAAAGRVYGNKGNDLAELSGTARGFLGAGDDRLDAMGGTGTVKLGSGDDRAALPAGSQTVLGGAGRDIFRLWWEDFLDEGPALEDPILVGGKGDDRLLWDVPEAVIIDVSDGEVTSGYGTARFAGVNAFRGGIGDDRLYGASGSQTLIGGRGDDLVKGYAGADVLRGGRGHDQAFGGPGRDVCGAEFEHGCERG